ncbi:YrbL family protein [Yoonia litorea]|nr:YrbL family protein [Yoonia litorea]
MAQLELNKDDQIASGVQRAIFRHPFDKTKLVKVLKSADEMPQRSNFNGRMDQLLPSTRLRQVRKEYQEYLRLMLKTEGREARIPISHMMGFVSTNLGLGCLTESVTEADGTLGKTLGELARSGSLKDEDLDLLNDAVSRIYRLNIRASDMNPKNFVLGHRWQGTALGPRECVLVDGFGDIHAIPIRSLSNWTNRLGLDDSCARLARSAKLRWDKTNRAFTRRKES